MIGALAKTRYAQQVIQHAHHFRAFVVHGGGVEIVDLLVGAGAHGVCHGPCVLAELMGAQQVHIMDPVDAGGAHVGAELLIAENGKAFLQAQLEPVAAGHPVSGPVVKVFVADHALYA